MIPHLVNRLSCFTFSKTFFWKMIPNRVSPLSCFTFCVVLLFAVSYYTQILKYRPNFKSSPRYQLNFLPNVPHFCESLSLNVSMSPNYLFRVKEFEEAVKNATAGELTEGHSAQVTGQYKMMHYLVQQEATKVVCETGFNMGHSSFNYLTANDRVIVHSFDLGKHNYTSKMSNYLTEKFPNRFFIHFGNSTTTLPEFIHSHPGFKCDLMFVDGGRVYPVALADLKNFARIANLEENIIIFDDYPTESRTELGEAWEEVVKEHIIAEISRCAFRNVDLNSNQRGFTLGRVVMKSGNYDTAAIL